MKQTARAAIAAAMLLAFPALAGDANIMIHDPYARSGAKSGAAFFVIMNHTDQDDRLVAASSDAAPRVELHTHIMKDGVAMMRPIEGGIAIPAGQAHALARGGDHVMLMGLEQALEDGGAITLKLTFEKAGEIMVEIPVDNARKPSQSDHANH